MKKHQHAACLLLVLLVGLALTPVRSQGKFEIPFGSSLICLSERAVIGSERRTVQTQFHFRPVRAVARYRRE
jgi:hypothetical protein